MTDTDTQMDGSSNYPSGEDNGRDDTMPEYETMRERLLKELLGNKLRLLSAIVVVLMIGTAIFAPYIAPHDEDDTFELMQEPGSYSEGDFNNDGQQERVFHALGTNSYGNDILTRVIYGAQISMLVALSTIAISFTIGTAIGLYAGFRGGWVDNLLMRYIDFQWAFPELVLALGVIAFFGGLGVVNVVIAVSLAFVDDFARLVRGEALWIREEEYVLAAHVLGLSDRRIMLREMLPNAMGPLIVQATVMIPLAIIAEAGLSFLGLGVKPTTPTWGLLIADGRGYITTHWWISVMPGLAIMITVLAFNLLGDGLRDALDVKDQEVSQ
ncbi:ABC transporter permease [Halorubrum trueperi]|uniref:ABC transporter permease n=1 Tax=Halorubrum trueperi TaxID=2004704 RepID=A0ABD5UKE2_9EURY